MHNLFKMVRGIENKSAYYLIENKITEFNQ